MVSVDGGDGGGAGGLGWGSGDASGLSTLLLTDYQPGAIAAVAAATDNNMMGES